MTPGIAVRHASVARHVTYCATRPGKKEGQKMPYEDSIITHSFQNPSENCIMKRSFNPFNKLNGISHYYQMDQSISVLRGVG